MTVTAQSSLQDLGTSYHRTGDLTFACACYKKSLHSHINSSKRHVLMGANTTPLSVNSRNVKNLYLHEVALQTTNSDIEGMEFKKDGNCDNLESSFIGMKCYLSPLEMEFCGSGDRGNFNSSMFTEEEIALANIFGMSQIYMKIGQFDTAAKLLDISLRLCHSRVTVPSTPCSPSSKIEMMALTNMGYIS